MGVGGWQELQVPFKVHNPENLVVFTDWQAGKSIGGGILLIND